MIIESLGGRTLRATARKWVKWCLCAICASMGVATLVCEWSSPNSSGTEPYYDFSAFGGIAKVPPEMFDIQLIDLPLVLRLTSANDGIWRQK